MMEMIERYRTKLSQALAVIFILVFAFSNNALEWTYPAIPGVMMLAGCTLVGIATVGRLWCALYIAGYKTDKLITSGPYSMCRNPLYFFSLLGGVGVGLCTEYLTLAAVIIVAFIGIYPVTIKREEERLKKMTFYCFASDCLRAYILHYFGEQAPRRCENCSTCLQGGGERDVTKEAELLLSCVRACGRGYGKKTVAALLAGGAAAAANDTVRRRSLDQLSQYGALSGFSVKEILSLIDHAIGRGLLEITEGDYPLLALTQDGESFLQEGGQISMWMPEKEEEKRTLEKRKFSVKSREEEMTERPELYEKLRVLRARLAARAGVPAYVVFTDRALREMAGLLPLDEQELLAVNGVGRARLERYGGEFLRVLNEYAQEHGKNS